MVMVHLESGRVTFGVFYDLFVLLCEICMMNGDFSFDENIQSEMWSIWSLDKSLITYEECNQAFGL